MNRTLVVCLLAVACIPCAAWSAYRWYFPYGQSHCCDKQLCFGLHNYADQHGGRFPSGEKTAEASLSLLFPIYADADLLRGKTSLWRQSKTFLRAGGFSIRIRAAGTMSRG